MFWFCDATLLLFNVIFSVKRHILWIARSTKRITAVWATRHWENANWWEYSITWILYYYS